MSNEIKTESVLPISNKVILQNFHKSKIQCWFTHTWKINTFKTNVFDYFYIFTNFSYYFGFVPFKVSVGLQNGSLHFHESRFQKVVCWTLNIVCVCKHLLDCKYSFIGSKIKADPMKIYEIWKRFAELLMLIDFFRTNFFGNRNGLKFLLESTFAYYKHNPTYSTYHIKQKNKIAIVSLIVFYIIMDPVNRILTLLEFSSFIDYINKQCGQFLFYLNLKSDDAPLVEQSAEMWKIAMALFTEITDLAGFAIRNLSEIFVTFCCMSILQMSSDFWKVINEDINGGFQQHLNNFKELKNLTKNLNRVCEFRLVIYILTAVPIFGMYFTEILDNSSWSFKLGIIYYLCGYIITLSIACEGHKRIEAFQEHLYQSIQKESRLKGVRQSEELSLFVAVTEVSTSNVGLKGRGFFTFTYSFLGSTVSMIMTYIIIMLQFQNPRTCN